MTSVIRFTRNWSPEITKREGKRISRAAQAKTYKQWSKVYLWEMWISLTMTRRLSLGKGEGLRVILENSSGGNMEIVAGTSEEQVIATMQSRDPVTICSCLLYVRDVHSWELEMTSISYSGDPASHPLSQLAHRYSWCVGYVFCIITCC